MSGTTDTVGLACGDPVTHAGLRDVLEAAGFQVGPEPEEAATLAGLATDSPPDLWLVDAAFPGGAAAAVRILTSHGRPVVVLSAEHDDRAVLEVVEAGAMGYLPVDLPPDRLPAVLRRVLEGEAAIPRRLMGRVLSRLHAERSRLELETADGRIVTLSPRESAVLESLSLGRSVGEVAAQLGLSPVTVRRHAASAVHKLGAPSRAAAIALVAGRAG